jgi:hypothetical protein
MKESSEDITFNTDVPVVPITLKKPRAKRTPKEIPLVEATPTQVDETVEVVNDMNVAEEVRQAVEDAINKEELSSADLDTLNTLLSGMMRTAKNAYTNVKAFVGRRNNRKRTKNRAKYGGPIVTQRPADWVHPKKRS